MGGVRSFLVETKWLAKALEAASCKHGEVIFVAGGGDGQLPSLLSEVCHTVAVEPDEALANYLYSLGLFRTTVINAQPHLVLGDAPFNKLLCMQPSLLDSRFLESMLQVSFDQAVLIVPDDLLGHFRARDRLGCLLRASFDVEVLRAVPKAAYAPALAFPASLIRLSPTVKNDPVAASLRLILQEAGTMRGLLTRSCREFFGYTLAEAQEAVRLLDQSLLKKRFWEVSDDEFKAVHEWLRLG